jgi:hypothetical protein
MIKKLSMSTKNSPSPTESRCLNELPRNTRVYRNSKEGVFIVYITMSWHFNLIRKIGMIRFELLNVWPSRFWYWICQKNYIKPKFK